MIEIKKSIVDKAVEAMNPDDTIAALEWLTEKMGDDYLQFKTADEIVALIAGINCYGRSCDKFDLEFLLEHPDFELFPHCMSLGEVAFAYAKDRELVEAEVYDDFDYDAYGKYLKHIYRRGLQHVEYETDDYYFDGYVLIYNP